jgi:glycosyltransferase involved in cell wall biosynthesis
MKITACVVVRNEAENLIRYFQHVRRFCNEVIVCIQKSDDNTIRLCQKYADQVILSENIGYNELDRPYVCSLAKNNWVCTLDPDEQFENEFVEDLPKLMELCEDEKYDGISCKIQNIYNGFELDMGDLRQIRLAKKTAKQSTRIHTGFACENFIQTNYIQYHFKKYDKALETEEWRSKHYTDDRIKNNLVKYYNSVKSSLDVEKEKLSEVLNETRNRSWK